MKTLCLSLLILAIIFASSILVSAATGISVETATNRTIVGIVAGLLASSIKGSAK